MILADAQAWERQLHEYSYPEKATDARAFGRWFRMHEPWFAFELERWDRDQTIRFEERFREFGSQHLEAWYEVIFWKFASTGPLGVSRAKKMIKGLRTTGSKARDLWDACSEFVETGSRKAFEVLQLRISIKNGGIPVAATFPAFMCPERFPMVDRWIAYWVSRYIGRSCDAAKAIRLVLPSEGFLQHKKLTVSGDWDFYFNWTRWCRNSADVLSDCTRFRWRARDVEMAAFMNAKVGTALLPQVAG